MRRHIPCHARQVDFAQPKLKTRGRAFREAGPVEMAQLQEALGGIERVSALPVVEKHETMTRFPTSLRTAPVLVFHSKSKFQLLDGFFDVVRSFGIKVVREDYSIEKIKDPSKIHLLWGMSYRPPVYAELAKFPNAYFLENGWFTQKIGFYMDKLGPNGMSSIRHELANRPEIDTSEVDERLENLHRKVNVRPVEPGGHIFLPLQVERDTQLLFWSNAPVGFPKRQTWLVDQVCRAFPNHRIIIRPHPRDPSTPKRVKQDSKALASHRSVEFRSDGTSYDYAASAEAVVGFNSTVLLEALTFFKPVAAMGTGLFEGNGTMLECDGKPERLSQVLRSQPDASQICRFLALLYERQIPYNLQADQVHRYPVLWEMLQLVDTQIKI